MLDDDVWRYLPFGPGATLAIIFCGGALLVVVTWWRGRAVRRVAWVALGVVVLVILALTLGGGGTQVGRQINWHPGAGIRSELSNVNRTLGLVNVVGNIAFFVPLGWLLTVLTVPAVTRSRVARGTLAGLLLSAGIEITQYAVGRAMDVDDVLLNTTGALLGAVAGAGLAGARAAYDASRSRSHP